MAKPTHLIDKLTNDPEKDFATLKQIWLAWKLAHNKKKECFGCTIKKALKWLTEK